MAMEKKIYIVGIGPGETDMMTLQAKQILANCDVIVGYTVYVDLVRDFFPGKEFLTTPMRQEIERCRMTFERASKGAKVAMICSGDAGVYGMAAPIYELVSTYEGKEEYQDIDIEVIPGITAALSGAAVLGAPLNHDFCVISLSDLLTPWEAIEKRLIAALQGDFAMAIYNPASHKRKDYLRRACEILLCAGAEEDRVCGYVENIGREGTNYKIMTLKELKNAEVNMFTTVFIGNSQTYVYDNHMITKRGYVL